MRRRRWAWLVLALCAGLGAPAAPAAPTEDECVGADGDEVEYRCRDGQYEIRGTHYQYVDIVCQGTELNCSTFPRKAFSKNSTLDSLSIRNCSYEGAISCLLHRMNVADVKKVTLRDFLTPLTEKHVEGLHALTAFRIYDKGVQRWVPYEALASLPSLKEFRLHRGHVTLAPGSFQAPSLTFLELSSDSIEELPPGAFRGLPNLQYLGLWRNDLKALQQDAFQGIETLSSLNLAQNALPSLGPGPLARLEGLGTLILTGNPLTELQNGVFQGLHRLENITISSTKSLKLGSTLFGDLSSLRNLDLEACQIQDLPSTVFQGSTIHQLSLKQNHLERLHPDVFRGQTEMVKLDLSRNKLSEVTDDLFMPLKKLAHLDLSHNRIESFAGHLFSALTKLETLWASNNELKHIAETAFQGMPLRTLKLSNNRLSFTPEDDFEQYRLDPCPFNGLLALQSLDLRNNSIDAICDYWRIMMTRLETLDLSYNKFTELTTADLAYTSSRITVDLRHNNITSVIVDPGLWPELGSTATVLLGHNPFSCDCYMYAFVQMAKSTAYSRYFPLASAECATPELLRGTNLAKVPMEKFQCYEANCAADCECVSRPAKNMIEAECSALRSRATNVLEPVALKLTQPPRSLKHLPFQNVVEIDLSGLNLTDVPYDQFPKSVKLFNLSNNHLEYLPSEFLSKDVKFAIRNNSLSCDCWSYEHVLKLLGNVSKIVDFDQVTCSDGTPLSLIDGKRLCDVWLASSIGVSLTALGILCIILAAVVYKYSFELKIYVAKFLPCLLPEEKYDASKKYDVFVSYAHKDEDFVRDELLVRLEGPPNHLKTCVHHRDWLVGETIPYNIAKSVEESRRTVIVLSENFLGSMWALMEFRAAHVQAAREGRARVIIILLEDVSDRKELDREIRAYLHTNTYIKWGEPWFWEKLFYALPRRGRVVDRSEERRIQAVAKKLVQSGLDVKLNSEGKLVNAAFVKDI